jgi:hypothetical protein
MRMQVDIWSSLQEVVEQCWVLWELMVLAKPLLVLAPSPGTHMTGPFSMKGTMLPGLTPVG